MDRQEIQNRIFRYFREQLTVMDDPHRRPQIQMGFLNSLFEDVIRILPQHKGPDVLSVAREIVHLLENVR